MAPPLGGGHAGGGDLVEGLQQAVDQFQRMAQNFRQVSSWYANSMQPTTTTPTYCIYQTPPPLHTVYIRHHHPYILYISDTTTILHTVYIRHHHLYILYISDTTTPIYCIYQTPPPLYTDISDTTTSTYCIYQTALPCVDKALCFAVPPLPLRICGSSVKCVFKATIFQLLHGLWL